VLKNQQCIKETDDNRMEKIQRKAWSVIVLGTKLLNLQRVVTERRI